MTTTPRAVLIPAGNVAPRWGRYMFLGSVAGFVLGLTILFAGALSAAPSDSVGSCLAAACALTLLLSQPVALSGVFAGAVLGGMVGSIVHLMRGP